MIYYGNNDYRDYLAHYGVLGMHWGIRRYQPYSYTEGRDGFRKGKEKGDARKLGDIYTTRQNKKRDRYVARETAKVEKAYNKMLKRSDKKIDKYEKKLEKAASAEKKNKISKKLTAERVNRRGNEAKRKIEKSALNHYTYDDVKREKKAVFKHGMKVFRQAMAVNAEVKVTEMVTGTRRRRVGLADVLVTAKAGERNVKTNARIDYENNRKKQRRGN